MNEKLENLKKFLYLNSRIKNEMVSIGAVSCDNLSTEDGIVKYTNDINDSLRYIFDSLKKMISSMNLEGMFLGKVLELEKTTFDKFYDCKLDVDKLKHFYQYSITEMDDKFVEKVRATCVGYSLFDRLDAPVNNANTINEILHVMHSFVLNNEDIYQSINVVASKPIDEYSNITLYGSDGEFAKNIFINFPVDMDCSYTDIVSITDNKVIIMIRDKGHALTMEIDKMDEEVRCGYFIPKLCNIEMINKLPGVRKVNDDAPIHSGTNGVFYSSEEEFLGKLYTFINMVPTDSDMVRENYNFSR